MQTVEVIGDFYTFKSHAQHPINSHALTNQFKQVLRRFSELTRFALVWSVARRMRPFKGVGVGHGGGMALFVLEVLHTRGFLSLLT